MESKKVNEFKSFKPINFVKLPSDVKKLFQELQNDGWCITAIDGVPKVEGFYMAFKKHGGAFEHTICWENPDSLNMKDFINEIFCYRYIKPLHDDIYDKLITLYGIACNGKDKDVRKAILNY